LSSRLPPAVARSLNAERGEFEGDGPEQHQSGTTTTVDPDAEDGAGSDGSNGNNGRGSSRSNNNNEDDDAADRLAALERRLAATVHALGRKLGRMQQNMLMLADDDPLKRQSLMDGNGEDDDDGDEQLRRITAAYRNSSYGAARLKDGDHTVVKIGDRRDALVFDKGRPGSASPRGGSSSSTSSSAGGGGSSVGGVGNPVYQTRSEPKLVAVESGRKPNGSWTFSPAQVALRHKETRDIAQKNRADTPMRHMRGRDDSV
jgi:hypothetical protein